MKTYHNKYPNVISLKKAKLKYGRCKHMSIIVDHELSEVECSDCGEKLNPVETLSRFAREQSLLFHRINEGRALEERLKKRVRTKCQHCGRMTSISV